MKARPLIVSDCDGVLLHFIAPFVDYLREVHGLTLSMDSFALTGNVKRADGTAVEPAAFPPLLNGFFADWMHNQHPIIGAADSLGQLARDCDVVVLTNIAYHHAERRTFELARLGMPYRVIGNQGGKGAPLTCSPVSSSQLMTCPTRYGSDDDDDDPDWSRRGNRQCWPSHSARKIRTTFVKICTQKE